MMKLARAYSNRFRVEDLVPSSPASAKKVRAIFIGKSPHRDEVAPEDSAERNPFRGVAGREWWTEVFKFSNRKDLSARPVPARRALVEVCEELGIAIMNAIQFPIDPKITLHQGEASQPRAHLGFEKAQGEFGYKAVVKQKGDSANPVEAAIRDLAARLEKFCDSSAQIVCLGNDSRWFVERAFDRLPVDCELRCKPLMTVPHPSSWWRNASYRQRAVDALDQLLLSAKRTDNKKSKARLAEKSH